MHELEVSRKINKHKNNKTIFIFIIVLIVFLLTAGLIYWNFFKPSEVKLSYFEGDNPILFNGEQLGNAVTINDSIYMTRDALDLILPDLFHYDLSSDSLIMTTNSDVIQLFANQNEYMVNRERTNSEIVPVVYDNETVLISLDWLKNYYPIDFSQYQSETIRLYLENQEKQYGIVKDSGASVHQLRLRSSQSIQAPYYVDLSPNEKVMIEKEISDFYYVRKLSGEAGFIKKKWIDTSNTESILLQNPRAVHKLNPVPERIFLTWEAVYNINPDTSLLPDMPGLNVVSPTWFHIADPTGNLTNLASENYLAWAKERGYQVWALFSNDFDPELTHQALNNYDTRTKIINQLVEYSKQYNLDGINFDIENVNLEDGPLVTQLMQEAAPILHKEGLIVSMDITFISDSGNWSKFLERDKLKDVVDYMIVMAYDEHTASSSEAGSVSSIPWVEANLERLLEVVPNEKVILGIPYYTRLWTEKLNASGQIDLSSKALTMDQATSLIEEKRLEPVYDEITGQNYVEWQDELGIVNKMWLEDQTSLRKRANLASSYNLAGIGTWSRYFANDMAWSFLNEFYVVGE